MGVCGVDQSRDGVASQWLGRYGAEGCEEGVEGVSTCRTCRRSAVTLPEPGADVLRARTTLRGWLMTT